MFRFVQNDTLIKGWWGIISFFTNFGYIMSNMAQRQHVQRLGTPAPTPRTLISPQPHPLPVGNPISRSF
jgi:hypothetical protein